MAKMPYLFLARVRRTEEVPGITTVTLELIQDQDAVEVREGDEFVSVGMVVNPFRGG